MSLIGPQPPRRLTIAMVGLGGISAAPLAGSRAEFDPERHFDALRKAHFRVLSAVTRRTRSLLVIEDNARLRAI